MKLKVIARNRSSYRDWKLSYSN